MLIWEDGDGLTKFEIRNAIHNPDMTTSKVLKRGFRLFGIWRNELWFNSFSAPLKTPNQPFYFSLGVSYIIVRVPL